jgi:hypothetical protein
VCSSTAFDHSAQCLIATFDVISCTTADSSVSCIILTADHVNVRLCLQIIETMEMFEIVWNIPLNNGHSKIKKSDRYLKNSEVCELPRRDGRQGVLRSQINFTPEGHVHIR